MRHHSHPDFHLHEARRAMLLRWAQMAQWFGLVMILLTIGLAALGDSLEDPTGTSIITLCGALGLAALVPARMILAHYQKQDERDGQP